VEGGGAESMTPPRFRPPFSDLRDDEESHHNVIRNMRLTWGCYLPDNRTPCMAVGHDEPRGFEHSISWTAGNWLKSDLPEGSGSDKDRRPCSPRSKNRVQVRATSGSFLSDPPPVHAPTPYDLRLSLISQSSYPLSHSFPRASLGSIKLGCVLF
jgi:hypothetical protein